MFGQLLGDYSVSPLRLMLGAGFWAALIVFAVVLARKDAGQERTVMTAFFIVFGTITLVAGSITLLDDIAYRRNRRAHR